MLRFNKMISLAIWAVGLLALSAIPGRAQEDGRSLGYGEQSTIGLMGTIPIYWGEVAGFDELVTGEAPSHWARDVLERRAQLAPLDYLSDEALAPYRHLLLAQPRGLSGEENVALDAWVREGGRLLLFADPWMTGESRFHIGDRRRPQDVTLLSPILARWGLELMMDATQEKGPDVVDRADGLLPVNMFGVFRTLGEGGSCALEQAGLLAHCRIGAGQVLIMADAAILDAAGPYPHAESGFESLLEDIFPQMRENAGIRAGLPQGSDESDGNPAFMLDEQQPKGAIATENLRQ